MWHGELTSGVVFCVLCLNFASHEIGSLERPELLRNVSARTRSADGEDGATGAAAWFGATGAAAWFGAAGVTHVYAEDICVVAIQLLLSKQLPRSTAAASAC